MNTESEPLKINIIGDIVFPPYNDYNKYNFKYINQFLNQNSINIGNLEAPILFSPTLINKKELQRKRIIMYSEQSAVIFLKTLNISAVSLANNHIFDFGYEGFKQTVKILSENNIEWFGAGKNLKSSIKPLVIKKNNIKIGLIGIGWSIIESINSKKESYGVPSINYNYLSLIDYLKKKIDFLIIYFHWGYEHERFPLPYQREIAHKMIDFGANLIIGSHPHRIQGIEKYSNGLIVYSLGNFIIPSKKYIQGYFTPKFPLFSNISFILNLELSKDKILNYNVIPFKLLNNEFQKLSNDTLFSKILTSLSDPLVLKKKEYRNFFRINRSNRYLPILTNYEYFNIILFQLFNLILKIFVIFRNIPIIRILIKRLVKL